LKVILIALAGIYLVSSVTCPGYLYSDNNWPKSVDCSSNLPSSGTCDFANYIAPHEGCSYCAYKDSLGLPTIGIGYLLEKGQDQPLPSGLNFEELVSGNEALNGEQVVQMFQADVQAAITLDQQIFSNWNQLCCNIELVLVDMTFVMMYKLKQFHHMIAAVESENWEEAAAQIESSTWCSQVHTRCTDDVNKMKQGCPKNGEKNNEEGNKKNNEEGKNSEKNNEESQPQTLQAQHESSTQSEAKSSTPSNESSNTQEETQEAETNVAESEGESDETESNFI